MLLRALVVVFQLVVACVCVSQHVQSAVNRRTSTNLTNLVTWDSHSLSLFGQRVFILSAEFHPWRLPNPDLWLDVLQKIKANGFNTVQFIVDWALHYPSPSTGDGNGDWQEGTYRDVQRFIDDAKTAGLWLMVRRVQWFTCSVADQRG